MRTPRKSPPSCSGVVHEHYHLHAAPVREGHDHEHSHDDPHHRFHVVDPSRGIFDEGMGDIPFETADDLAEQLERSIEAVKARKNVPSP